MASVSIVLRTDRVNKGGDAPINFFVVKNRKLTKISTGLMVNPKHWDNKNKKVKSGFPNSGRFNSFLSNKFAELQDQVLEHETFNKSLTTKQLKNKIYGKEATNFFDFGEQVLDGYDKRNMFGTHTKSKSILNKLKEFNGSKNLIFQDITPTFLDKYDTYCRKTWNNKTNTVLKDMKFIRKVFNDAIRMDLIDIRYNPFLKYKLKSDKTQRTFLNEQELTAFSKVKCISGSQLELHKDMFIFSAYTGLRVSDILQLKWGNFDKTHINFTIRKTGAQISIKLPDQVLEIIRRYRPKKVIHNHYVFPMIDNSIQDTDLRLIHSSISTATAKINKSLKSLSKSAKITKHITFHISRHTFATRAIRKGISIDKVSKIMGHSEIKETQIYAKIINEELDKAMDMFNN